MRVLFVSPFLPHVGARHGGGKLAGFLLDRLVERHEVALATRVADGEEAELRGVIDRGVSVEVVASPGPWYRGGPAAVLRSIASYRRLCRGAATLARRWRPDVCQLVDSETAYFWPAAEMPPAVIVCHDLVAKRLARENAARRGPARLVHALAAKVQSVAERRALERLAAVFLLSRVELDWCRAVYPAVEAGLLRYPAGVGFTGMPRREAPGRVLFLGALGRPQNRDALGLLLDEIWPRVRQARPEAELHVVGGGAAEDLAARLARTPGVVAAGEVDSVEPAYAEAAVFVAPITVGGGIIVKVLDALAAGVATVTTPRGNEGIEAEPGHEILVADEPAELAASVVRLLEDAALRRAIGEAGRARVRRDFPASGPLDSLEPAYRRAALDRGADAGR